MLRFLFFLVILIFSVWLGLKVAEDPGYAVFAYRHWSVEMPLWFALVSFLVLLFVLYGVLRFFDSIDFTIYRWKNWLRWRRKYKSYSKTNRGLIELIEGHWRSAEYYLLEGVPQSDAPLINYLAAAKSAHEQGAFDRRDMYLRKAHDFAPQADVAIGLTQAQLQVEQGQLEQAVATLGHLRNVAPKHPFVLKLLEKVYIRLADWSSLIKLLPFLRKAKIITADQLQLFEKNTYLELLHNAEMKNVGLVGVQQLWESIPKKFQQDSELTYSYAKLLLPYPEVSDDVESLIRKCVKKAWDKNLVRLYGLVVTKDPKKQLAVAESWHKQYGNQAVLLLTLGRLCMRCQLWGKARSYFEESIKLEASPETYMEYGKLLEQMGEMSSAMKNYRDGLVIASNS
ncbi:MAG: heme biosynthesis HemY N-terminal domain-containing protein [Gammaproteobacteria bacterium]